MSVEAIFGEVLREITPTDKDEDVEKELVHDILEILRAVIQGIAPEAEPIMVGSLAKGTDLRGDKDFDIFVQFPKDTPREQLEAKGLAIGKKFFELVKSKPELSYAEHPYVKGSYHGFTVEIVPCYKISPGDQIQSAVDRSPLHTLFVKGELSRRPMLRNQIRLLKKFMKVQGLYGAHAAVEGFSGYLCELLIIKYGSFADTLIAAVGWKKGQVIRINETISAKDFPDAPLIFIDPVDLNRNVAAAVSTEKMAGFIYQAEEFILNPSKEFFVAPERKPLSKRDFKGRLSMRGTHLIAVHFFAPMLVEDTLVPQIMKSLGALRHECERSGFRVLKSGQWTDGKEVVLLVELEVWELPRVAKKKGPFFDSKVADMRGFIEANKDIAMSQIYLEGDEWAVDVARAYSKAPELIKAYLREPKGFGKNLREVKRFSVHVNSKLLKIKNPEFWEYMSGFW